MHILVRAFELLFVAVYISFVFDFQAKEKISSLETVSWSAVHCSLLLRIFPYFCPKKFGEAVMAEVLDKRAIPSWAGFDAILYPEMPIVSNIGYCPMVNGSSNDYSTIYIVLKHAQKIMAAIGQANAVITFDLAIYSKAKKSSGDFLTSSPTSLYALVDFMLL